MKESELLGKLMPGHPDIFPIIENIRAKYGIPPVNPEDDIDAILLTRDDIDWDAVHQDIESQVQNVQLLDDKTGNYIQALKQLQNIAQNFPELEGCPEETREQIKQLFTALIQPFI